MKLTKEFVFDSAHCLPLYEGKCNRLHGHRWTLHITISGGLIKTGPYQGMVLDFGVLAKQVEPLISRLDHRDLNTFILNPTCENLLFWIGERLCELALNWTCLTLEESPGASCTLSREEYEMELELEGL
jgi:6-pyruvoyltetrahydropterin/6-carboxytetrahydropterin synthase